MTKQKSLIGMELDSSLFTIEASQITRLNHAFYLPNYFSTGKTADEQPNKNHIFHNLPPFLLGNLVNLATIYKALGLNINNVLLSRESIITHFSLKVGDTVTIRTFLKDAYEQQASGNPIGFIILESAGSIKEDIAFYCERVLAVRGGFQRGRVT